MPARAATAAICTAAMPPSLAIRRAAVMIASWRAARRRTTFSVRRYGKAVRWIDSRIAYNAKGSMTKRITRHGTKQLVWICGLNQSIAPSRDMAFARVLIMAFVAALFADPALAADPRPPQLQITFLSEPAPIVQYGSTKLVYEMEVTNFSKRSYVFDSIDAKAGGAPFSFSGTTLAGMMTHLGPWDSVAGPESRTIAAGRSLVVYF